YAYCKAGTPGRRTKAQNSVRRSAACRRRRADAKLMARRYGGDLIRSSALRLSARIRARKIGAAYTGSAAERPVAAEIGGRPHQFEMRPMLSAPPGVTGWGPAQ